MTGAITASPGEIRVASATLILDAKHVRAWDIDLHTKYAEVAAVSDGGIVCLGSGERTLRADTTRPGQLTAVTVPVPDGWTILAEVTRYTLRIVAFRPADKAEPVEILDAEETR